ncbi:MAG: DMT family transporter [Chloroflexi bacterium]|uniref:DMT family transporter n=1 Tax=Candidatus Chlorohelix allophototropha TaxID=3003348 RepID=A0A8T7M392_9CHLR|nr:DMT family transporter [Chloroflexota bacterium]WJW65592.1 DMT family transporter [Chloroflexota bacterium L227-S17]
MRSKIAVAHETEALVQEVAQHGEAQKEKRLGLIYSLVAVGFFGTSAVMVLYANPVPPVEKSFWRLIIATLFIFTLLKITHEPLGIKRKSLPRFALYGLITAAHFVLYIASLSFTTAAHTLTLVYTSPAFVAIFSAIFLKEHISKRRWGGVAIAALGVGILAGFEPKLTPEMLLGDSMALASAVAYGLYSIAGRRERNNYSLLSYAFGLYGFAMLWMFPAALLSFSLGEGFKLYSWGPALALLGLGIVPLGLGHTLYNAGLRRLNATYVNVIATQEVTLGVFFAWAFYGQVPSISSLFGALVTLLGVLVVLI